MRYITETRNLFDINSAVKVSGFSSFSKNENQITVSQSNTGQWSSANVLLDTSIVGKTITITTNAKTDGINNTYIRIQWLASDGLAGGLPIESNYISGNSYQKLTLSGVVPEQPSEKFKYLCLMFYSNASAVLKSGVTYSSTFKDIQLELGSTATDYVPYGYLPMRRMKYKVSNVCQLLDKSKYKTQTDRGVTFTNNGDGSITVNGTPTGTYYSLYTIYINLDVMIPGHKYAILGTADKITLMILGNYTNGYIFKGSNDIYTLPEHEYTRFVYEIRANLGYTYSNVLVKPQLFDLTEMYGAGNEPTTVEEFRQDFPEEMYDYSPYCWASMKNIRYIDTTKNLFDISKAVKVSGGSSLSIDGKYLTVSDHSGNTHISANILLDTSLVGKTVTFSAYAKTSDKNTAYLRIQWLNSNGLASTALIMSNNVSGQTYQKVTLTGVVPEQPGDEFNMLCLSFYSNGNKVILPSQLYTVVYTDIQLELGDTATPYVPYGYLPLN